MAYSKEQLLAMLAQMLTVEKWRDIFSDFMTGLLDSVADKAAAEHTHEGGLPIIITRGTPSERNATGVTVHVRTDAKSIEYVVDGSFKGAVAPQDGNPLAWLEYFG